MASAYALGETGSATCPDGYAIILDDADCAAAAQSLGLHKSDARNNDAWCPTQRPQGCFQYTGNSQVYNNDQCDGGVDAGDDKRVCRKASLPELETQSEK